MAAKVYLDTNVFIRAFEGDDVVSRALVNLMGMDVAYAALATSELTLAELLVHPYRHGDDVGRLRYENAIRSSTWLQVGPVNREVLVGASLLRSKYRLKLPDAIHLSTSLHIGCALLITDDSDLQGEFDVSYTSPDQHWPKRIIQGLPLDLPSIALVAERLRP